MTKIIKILSITFLLTISILNLIFANFSDEVEATSNISGKLDMQFNNAKIISIIGADENTTKIEILQNSDSLVVNAGNLQYPGAKVEFSVDIINLGSITAKLESIDKTDINIGKAIKVQGIEESLKPNSILKPGEKYTVNFSILWDENYNEEVNESINFEFKINYVQYI